MATVLTTDNPGAGIRSYTVRPAAGDSSVALLSATGAAATAALVGIGGVAGGRPGLVAACSLLVANLLWRAFSVVEESLLIMEGIGLQLCTRYASGRDVTQFIETAHISEIVITEAVRVDRCFYYLACLAHEEPSAEARLIVPFRRLLPPLDQLRQIYAGTRAVLWSEHEAPT